MTKTWKNTSLGLVMENADRYEEGFKTYHMKNVTENPEDTQVLSVGAAFSSLMGDKLENVELTKTTIISAN